MSNKDMTTTDEELELIYSFDYNSEWIKISEPEIHKNQHEIIVTNIPSFKPIKYSGIKKQIHANIGFYKIHLWCVTNSQDVCLSVYDISQHKELLNKEMSHVYTSFDKHIYEFICPFDTELDIGIFFKYSKEIGMFEFSKMDVYYCDQYIRPLTMLLENEENNLTLHNYYSIQQNMRCYLSEWYHVLSGLERTIDWMKKTKRVLVEMTDILKDPLFNPVYERYGNTDDETFYKMKTTLEEKYKMVTTLINPSMHTSYTSSRSEHSFIPLTAHHRVYKIPLNSWIEKISVKELVENDDYEPFLVAMNELYRQLLKYMENYSIVFESLTDIFNGVIKKNM